MAAYKESPAGYKGETSDAAQSIPGTSSHWRHHEEKSAQTSPPRTETSDLPLLFSSALQRLCRDSVGTNVVVIIVSPTESAL
jgi:hypothetical protein